MTVNDEAANYRIQTQIFDWWNNGNVPYVANQLNYAKFNRIAAEDRAMLVNIDRRDSDAQLRSMFRELLGHAPGETLKVLAIGDSITSGENSVEKTGYRGYLTDLVDRSHDRPVAFNTTAALSGQGLGGISAAVPAALAAMPDADIALVMVGTNDASFSVANAPNAGWQTQYAAMVDLILAHSPDIKVVCAHTVLADQNSNVPELSWGNGNYPIFNANQVRINGYVDNVVSARLATGRVAKAAMDTIPSNWLTDGGWHPGDAAYLRMAQIWLESIRDWL